MDFFQHQEQARKRTGLLVLCLIVALLAIIAGLYIVAALLLPQELPADAPARAQGGGLYWDPGLFGIVATLTLVVVVGASLVKTASLRGGGRTVAESLGGQLVPSDTRDPAARKLLNVVEEMAIAAGTPVPPVYLLEGEQGVNAFAAGWAPEDAVIGVTRGAVEALSRDELQGVVAHEFSHILNGDMRVNIRLMGIVFGLLVIALAGQILVRVGFFSGGSRRRNDKGGNAGLVIALGGLALIVLGYIGVFFGNLIKAAVSRQREFLADASAVQFTRNPHGIGGALLKIATLQDGSRVTNVRAGEMSHMFFGDMAGQRLVSAFATHPPLTERIRRIDPSLLAGEAPASVSREPRRATPSASAPRPPARGAFPAIPGMPGGGQGLPGTGALPGVVVLPAMAAGLAWAGTDGGAARDGARVSLTPDSALGRVGQVGDEHVENARRILAAIPVELREEVRGPLGARAAVYALLLAPGGSALEAARAALAKTDRAGLEAAQALAPEIGRLSADLRLPLVELAASALRSLSPEEFGVFRRNVRVLVTADGVEHLFEYALQRVLMGQLAQHFDGRRRARQHIHSLGALAQETATILSALAHLGSAEPARQQHAFLQGMAQAGLGATAVLPREACTIDGLDAAMTRFEEASHRVRGALVASAVAVVVDDGQVTVEEAELLRALCASLGCPMPALT